MHKTKQSLKKRILSFALAFVMVFGMMPTTAFATEEQKPIDTQVITAFELSEDAKIQTITVGSEETPNLPNKLNATFIKTTWEEVITPMGDTETATDREESVATPTNAEKTTGEVTSETTTEKAKETVAYTASTTTETIEVDVNWTADEEFSNAEAKTFVYTAELNDSAYTVASDVEIPTITVNVVATEEDGTNIPSDEKTITFFELLEYVKTQTINVDEDKAPTLPEMLNVTLKTDETVEVDVNWTVGEEFSNAEAKTFVYTAELNDSAYTVANDVEIPTITVNVVADAPANYGLMPNLMSLGNGLVDNGENSGYLTDSYGLMAYKYTGNNFDIHGKFDGNWKKVTYSNGGFTTHLKIGSTESNVSAVSSADGGYTVGSTGLNIAIDFIIQNEGQIIEVKYTVKNENANNVTFSLGSGDDIQIGSDDYAPITSFEGNTGFKMVSTKTDDKNAAGEYAQFNAFLKNAPGVDDVSGYWYGYYGVYDKNVFTDLSPKNPLISIDSGATWYWADKTIPANSTQTYSIKLGIGGKGSENAVKSGVDYVAEQLSELDPNATYKITVGGTMHELTADANGQIPLISDDYDFIGKTITIVKKGIDGAADSDASEVEIGARPPAPELEQTGGVIQDATTDLEYSLDGGNTWLPINADGALDEIYEQSETVLLRVKTTNSAPAGPAQNFAFFADSLPQWAKNAGLDEDDAMWNEEEQKLIIKDNVTLTDTLEVPDGSNVTIKVHEDETLTAPIGKPAITTNSDLTIGGAGTIKGSDGAESGSPAISVTGGNVTIDEDSTIEGGDATTGTGGSAIEVTGNTATVTNNGTITGGASDSGTGGHGISSDESLNVNGAGNITGGGSTNGAGGNGITVPKDKDVTVGDDSKINGGTSGDGDVSGGVVIEDDGYTVDYFGEKITIKAGYTAKIKGSTYDFSSTVDFEPNTTYIIKKGDVEIEFTTAARPTNPTLTQKQETVQNKKDGTIVGATDKMEYSDDDGATWKNVTNTPLTGFSDEKISIRIKATHNTPCSETVDFTFTPSTTTLEELATAKTEKETAIDEALAGYTESDYREYEWKALEKIFVDAKALVTNATEIATVEAVDVDTLKTSANTIKTNEQLTSEELATAKTEKKAEIDEILAGYTESDYREDEWTALEKIFADAKALVTNATEIATVETVDVDTLKTSADAIKTDAELTEYTVTLKEGYINASGQGDYVKGVIVTINAGTRDDYSFNGWTADGVTLADAIERETTFIMPENDVTLTANWKYNGGTEEAVVTPPTSTSDDNTSANIPTDDLKDAVKEALDKVKDTENTPKVTIVVDTPIDTNSLEVIVDSSSLKELADSEDGKLEVKSGTGTMTFDNKAVEAITETANGSEINLVIRKVINLAELTDEQSEVVGNSPIYELYIECDGERISDFKGGSVTVQVPEDLEVGENSKVTVYYIASDGTIQEVETVYDSVNKTVTFVTKHFSHYVIQVTNTSDAGTSGDNTGDQSTGGTDDKKVSPLTGENTPIAILAVTLVMAFVGVVVIVKKRKCI